MPDDLTSVENVLDKIKDAGRFYSDYFELFHDNGMVEVYCDIYRLIPAFPVSFACSVEISMSNGIIDAIRYANSDNPNFILIPKSKMVLIPLKMIMRTL